MNAVRVNLAHGQSRPRRVYRDRVLEVYHRRTSKKRLIMVQATQDHDGRYEVDEFGDIYVADPIHLQIFCNLGYPVHTNISEIKCRERHEDETCPCALGELLPNKPHDIRCQCILDSYGLCDFSEHGKNLVFPRPDLGDDPWSHHVNQTLDIDIAFQLFPEV